MSPDTDQDRIRVLKATGLLDSPREAAFDRLARMAARVVGAPVALISLVDEHRQFFKGAVGLPEPWASRRESPLTHSFCQHVVRERAPRLVKDARLDPLLRENLAIPELGVVAYAGVPLFVKGEAIGAFCVLDVKPREWPSDVAELLSDIAACVVSEIELRAALREAGAQSALSDAVMESIGDPCMVVDGDAKFLVVNHAARRVFAAEPGVMLPMEWADLHRSRRPDGAPLPSSEGPLVRGLRGESTSRLIFTLQRPDTPAPVWVEATGRPVYGASGEIIAAVAVYRDVTARKLEGDALAALTAELSRQTQLYRAIVQHLPGGSVFMLDRNLRVVSAEGPIIAEALQRSDLEGFVDRTLEEVVAAHNRVPLRDAALRTLAGESVRVEIARDGHQFEVRTVPVHSERGEVDHAMVFAFDVTDRHRESEELRQMRDALERERTLMETMLSHIEPAVALLDERRAVIMCNQAFGALIGLSREAARGLTRAAFVARVLPMIEDPETFLTSFMADGETNQQARGQDVTFVHPSRRVLRHALTPVEFRHGSGLLMTWHDVTAERALLQERERQLRVDTLTGIPNRLAAEAALKAAVARAQRGGRPLSLAILDIDNFKLVNDTHGHGAGDVVLKAVANGLAREARGTDMLARWGGEEFVAILDVPLAGARVFCERARVAIERMEGPAVHRVTVSAGVAELRAGESGADALARADQQLYAAKQAGRNRVAC